MKKVYLKSFAVCLFLSLVSLSSLATGSSNWSSKFAPQKVFIENKGQFKINETPGFNSKVEYAFDGHSQNFYFTKSGVVFELVDIKKPGAKESDDREMKERKEKRMSAEEHAKMEREENRFTATKDELRAQWIGADPNVEIISEEKNSAYYSYSFRNEAGTMVHENFIPGFKKLTYKNLYPNIDVVYEMHPTEGVKYSVIVHPGGDISKVKLLYSKNAHLLADGDIRTKSLFGDFIDHAPITFYQDDKVAIASSYKLKNNIISFSVGNYDHSKTLVIDPWTKTPSFSTQWQCVWECQKDAAGNVYIIGGVMPMQLLKYNSAGTLQWTYSTPYDTSNCWLGTFAVDNPGNSYVTAGSVAQIEKVNTAGSVVWNNSTVTGIFANTEFWTISFNCDQTQLVVGGTGGTLLSITPYIYNIDMTSGNVLNSVQATGGALIPTEEVRSITACGNGNYYFLTHDSIGYIHQGLTSCLPPGSNFPFHVNNGYNFGYKCEDFRVNNTGIRAMRAFGGYVYTHRGNQVHKRNFNTGAIVATGTIPGGAFTNSGFGGSYVSNSGIDIDSCGNVYVGSVNQVVKFDANLNQLGTYPTSSSFNVYDVVVSPTGDIIAAGTTGNDNSGARTGYVESFAGNACHTIAIVCCDASICPHANVCTTDPSFNFSATTAGGVWSGTGITNTSTGTFSPSAAGVGTFTIYYTLPCGRDSTTISVNSCTATSVCKNANGTLTVSGGTAPYTWAVWDSTGQVCQGGIVLFGVCTGTWVATYGWTNFATGATATPPALTDTIKVTDNSGTTITINNISAVTPCVSCTMVVSPGTTRNVTCFGGNTGAAHVTATGGATPYTYTWSPNVSTLDSAVNLTAGTYTVTVHDAGGCSGTATFTITQPAAALTATNVVTSASCGNSNGKIVLTASGGTAAYTYTWSPNVSTTDSAINLATGTYNITVKDAHNCTFATSVSVTTSTGVAVSPGATRNVTCFGGNTGAAHVTATGGATPYTYTWSPNVSTLDSAVNLTAGTYAVTVHDAGGCSGIATFTITQPAAALTATNVVTSASCGNSNGKIVLTASGGTAAYTYTWSPNVSTTDSAINLATGTYNITVKDAHNCTFATSVSVTTSIGVAVSPGATRNVNCFGGNTGAAHVTATGGTSPYTYIWSPNVSTLDSAVNLTAGTYTVTVHDAGGCSGTATFTITQPAAAVSATPAVTAATCGNSNGKIVFSVTGGTPGYTYVWSPNSSSTDSATNLATGTYHITITDSKSCTFTTTANVTSTAGITVTAGLKKDVNCFGGNTGSAHVTVTGGTTPYTYTWSPNVSTVDSAVNLTAGTYTVTVHDAGGCTGSATFTIIQPAAAVSATNTTVPATCTSSNGKVVFTVTGGTPAYSYVWSPNVSTVDSAINLAVGTYNVTITDSKGCIFTTSASVISSTGFSVTQGPKTNVKCFGGNTGSAYVTATGGSTPYTYTWSPNVSTLDSAVNLTAGTYTVTVHDANSCTGAVTFIITQPASAVAATYTTLPAYCGNSTGKVSVTATGGTPSYTYTWSPNVSTNDSAINLAAGSYLITVTDANLCTTTVSASVLPASGATVSLVSQKDVSCNGGSDGKIFVTTSGGVAPYSYTWSPAVSTTDSAVGLAQGSYSVTVRDANNCTSSISVTVNQPASLNITFTTTPADCGVSNGTATATVTGGAGAISYQWSAGGSMTLATDTALAVGSYTVIVTDVNHCTATGTTSVSNFGAPTATVASQVNENCNGGNTGKIVLSVASGTQPYSFTWSPNVSTVDSAVNLSAGTYNVTVHDASGCIALVSATITQPQALSVTAQSGNADCGQSNGWAKVAVTGGTGSYTYLWSSPQSSDSITGLSGGTYYVTITDSLGCLITDSAVVGTNNGPVAPTITAGGPLSFCQGGTVVLTSSAATGNTWSTGATTQSITVSTAGSYTVTQAVGGCTSPPSVAVAVIVNPIPAAPAITASGPTSFCPGGSVILTSSASSGNLWSDNETTQSITVNTAGTYTVSDTQAGCPSPVSAPVSVTIVSAPVVAIHPSQLSLCPGTSSVTLDATTASASAYLWSTNATQSSISVTTPGLYQVTVTVNGCIGMDSITITSEPLLGTLTLPDSFAICQGDSVSLDATTANATSYIWSGINATTPEVTVNTAGVYVVNVSNNCGALTASTTISIKDCECRIVMPNAFTPNGDGKNEMFGPNFKCENSKYLLMRIFNRWGEKIFETTDLNGQWDGKYKGTAQPPGVYVYYLEFVGLENNAEKSFKLMGSITLLR